MKSYDSPTDALRSFAQRIMRHWPEGGDLDMGDVQEAAATCGLLKPVTMKTACVEEGCFCEGVGADFPTTCYRRTTLLTGLPDSDQRISELEKNNVD